MAAKKINFSFALVSAIMLSFFYAARIQASSLVLPPSTPLDQQAYVWQRVWTPQHAQALAQSRALFSTLRVLAFQVHERAGMRNASVDLNVLRKDGRRTWMVVRLDGQLPRLNAKQIVRETIARAEQWQQQGVALSGVEVDYDAPTSQLRQYGDVLTELRQQLPESLQLSITALPAWSSSPQLRSLLRTADTSVLQVHSVLPAERGIFDPALARRWLIRYAQSTPHPFYVALPAYSLGLVTDGSNLLVESETPLRIAGPEQELFAAPQIIAAFLTRLKSSPVPHLAGLIWFRLPLADDRRTWSLATLDTVIQNRPLTTSWQLAARRQLSDDSLYDLTLLNAGPVDAPRPRVITVPAQDCLASDGAGGYQTTLNTTHISFSQQSTALLRAGDHYSIGWARCARLNAGGMHVVP